MTAEFVVLLVVIGTALAFDFTNGFHDTGNAMATSIATGALKPKVAVTLSAVLNLVGAFLSVEVAATIATGVVDLGAVSGRTLMIVVYTGLIGAILWNLITWLFGLPSSSSHALFGGLIGSSIAAIGMSGVVWDGVLGKVVVPAVLAPVVAALVAAVGTWSVHRIAHSVPEEARRRGFRVGQVCTASLVSLAHGTNDAQKTMGVIFLALVAHGTVTSGDDMPLWVKFACALAIALGTYLGGWRIIRTLGKGLVEITPATGVTAESSSAAIILTSSHFGLPLSTTHVATGSILGTGIGTRGGDVRWGVAGRMAIAWLITLPSAAVMGALCWVLCSVVGGLGGILLDLSVLVTLAGFIYLRSRRRPVDSSNVNAAWEDAQEDAQEDTREDAGSDPRPV